MTAAAFEALPRARRRRIVMRGLLRAIAIAVGLLALFYLLPMDRRQDSSAELAIAIAVGLIVITVVIGYEARIILRSPYPRVQALQAAFVAAPLFLVIFASAYFLMSASSPDTFSESLSRTDALYFTVTVLATVGFGDITAKTETARILVMVQMVSGLLFLGFGVRLLLGATQASLQREDTAHRDPTDGPPAA